jgi:hypothetical protein
MTMSPTPDRRAPRPTARQWTEAFMTARAWKPAMGIMSRMFRIIGIAERRRNPRLQSPTLRVEIDGIRYRTRDWSLSGFRVGQCHVPLLPGDRVAGRLHLPGAGGDGDFVAEVVWRSDGGDVGMMIRELAPRVLVAMGGLVAH